ncbi:MAG: GNAT family N-acetyltransferase [Malacoplasma sp.]
MTIKNSLNEDELKLAKELYKEAFNDTDAFIDLYFSSYAKNNNAWYGFNKDNQLVFMTWLNKKRIMLNDVKESAGFIVAVATKKEFQGQGIMKSFFAKWLNQISLLYKYIFIQAYNWDVYKSYNFSTCTIKKLYRLRKDQFLKLDEIFPITNYDLINEIYNNFVKRNGIENFSYRTSKENKLILKMFEAAGDKIIHTKKSYILLSNNVVVDYAFLDLKDFIRLLSRLPFDTKIYSYIDLDKRYFNLLEETKEETKILDNNTNILFNEFF